MEYYKDHKYFYNGSTWCAVRSVKSLIDEGYEPTKWDKNTFVKITYVPCYSSQIKPKKIQLIGTEPRNNNYSVHSHQYEKTYHKVSRKDFDDMEVKPTLQRVIKPLRLHNFDGFVDITQEEKEGKGWIETYQRDYNTTITKVFFVE